MSPLMKKSHTNPSHHVGFSGLRSPSGAALFKDANSPPGLDLTTAPHRPKSVDSHAVARRAMSQHWAVSW
jgi:hypothetical protein